MWDEIVYPFPNKYYDVRQQFLIEHTLFQSSQGFVVGLGRNACPEAGRL